MKITRLHRLLVPLLASIVFVHAASGADSTYRLSGIERVVAIADVHGAYQPFVELLQGTGLVDEELRWRGGESHLVIVGDILDRGEDSRAVLDLVMRLEREAPALGGAVHTVLGNHEVMNLVGELGYVSREEFASYADLESGGSRRRAESRFSADNPGLSRLALRSGFSRLYPRGFFGHREAFAPGGIYGRWLLEQPVLLVINDTAFVHGGLSPLLIGMAPEQINGNAREALAGYLEAMQVLIEEGLLFPETDFRRQARIADSHLARRNTAPESEVDRAAASLRDLAGHELFDRAGPLWYRGMVDCSPAIEQDRLLEALAGLGVRRLVIGHTPTNTHEVQERFDGALLLADTGMLASHYGGQPAALVFEEGEVKVFYGQSAAYAAPVPLPRTVGLRAAGLADEELEDLLADAPIAGEEPRPDGGRLLRLEHASGGIEAVFHPAPAPGFVPEAAAYRLDRLLGTDMVPVAVRRHVGGEEGAVHLDAQSRSAQAQLVAEGAAEPWCPLDDQQALRWTFDFLLNADQRPAEAIRYSTGSGKLVLVDNREILDGEAKDIPAPSGFLLPPLLRGKLEALDEESLAGMLGDVLDAPRRRALLERRDALLRLGRE